MQWLGGIGIVVMAITILPLLKVGGMQLFKMEGPDSTEKILPRTIEVAAIIISTYLVLTFLCGFFYWLFGMSIFDSVSHAMTTIATGGFSTHNDSIGFFKSSNIEIIASIFIILGSIPFISWKIKVSHFTNYDTPTFQLFQYENIDFLRYHNTVSKCYDTYNTITQAK